MFDLKLKKMDTNDALKLDKHIRVLQAIIPIESNRDRKCISTYLASF